MKNSVFPIELITITTEKDSLNQVVEKTVVIIIKPFPAQVNGQGRQHIRQIKNCAEKASRRHLAIEQHGNNHGINDKDRNTNENIDNSFKNCLAAPLVGDNNCLINSYCNKGASSNLCIITIF